MKMRKAFMLAVLMTVPYMATATGENKGIFGCAKGMGSYCMQTGSNAVLGSWNWCAQHRLITGAVVTIILALTGAHQYRKQASKPNTQPK
jgi:hypothetical protein